MQYLVTVPYAYYKTKSILNSFGYVLAYFAYKRKEI